MIGDRVRWGQPDPEGVHAHRGGVVRAVTLANSVWHVLVQRADGTFADELAGNLVAVEPGTSTDVLELEREVARLDLELVAEREQIIHLRDHIIQAGLEETGAPSLDRPCGAAIELLKTFQAELVAVGAARDDARTERDEAVARLTSAFDIMKAERDAAIKRTDDLSTEIDALKKPKAGGRNRPPERLG